MPSWSHLRVCAVTFVESDERERRPEATVSTAAMVHGEEVPWKFYGTFFNTKNPTNVGMGRIVTQRKK